MYKKIFKSLIIQSAGVLSSFMMIYFITNKFGLEAQGKFSIIKTWVDFIIVLGCFGLPQSIVFSINTGAISLNTVKKLLNKYLLIIFLPLCFFTYLWCVYLSELIFSLYSIVFLCLGILSLIAHSLLRGMYLTVNDGDSFAFISILPALFLLMITIGMGFYDEPNFSLAYFFTGLVSFCILSSLFKIDNPPVSYEEINLKPIFLNGASVFIQGLAMTLLPLLVLAMLTKANVSMEGIGGFNVALYFYMIFALPFSMVAPILYSRWSKININQRAANVEVKKLLLLSPLILLVCIVLYFFLPLMVPVIFKNVDVNLIIPSARILIFAALPLYCSRLLTSYFQSLGEFNFLTYHYCFKTIFCLIILGLFAMNNALNIIVASYTWVLSDFLLCLALIKKWSNK